MYSYVTRILPASPVPLVAVQGLPSESALKTESLLPRMYFTEVHQNLSSQKHYKSHDYCHSIDVSEVKNLLLRLVRVPHADQDLSIPLEPWRPSM